MSNHLVQAFPGLAKDGYRVTSPATPRYNCIAWAASRNDRFWWPNAYGYWPPTVVRAETLHAFIAAYETIGYRQCADGRVELRFEKIAIFVGAGGKPTHAARQLDRGKWTSKLGPNVDIEHATPEALSGTSYGNVATFMRRRRSVWRWPTTLLFRGLAWCRLQ